MRGGVFGLLVLLPLAGCAAPSGQPDLAGPAAIRALDRAKDLDARGDWAGLAAEAVPACAGPRDAVCAERQALRARGCARQAAVPGLSETARRQFLDCAVAAGGAALAAGEASPAAERAAWRLALADSLFERRQARPGNEVCEDNAPLLAEADRLHAADPAAPRPRFLAASARLTAVSRDCPPAMAIAQRCTELAAARLMLRNPPADSAAPWQALTGGIDATARRLACRIS
jgi:hypothetical protein